ncbi:unnamed protein product [Arabis nemorensis]|uniref:Fe2OG dioxygenase domain-containing protein n=1 Tax=Arabis nemorensis TaxID=586526 RepID=A0A565ALP4_9BRAS|nr:unnamed protein product [Arabis nemorensis]
MAANTSTEFDSYSERKAFDETKAGVKGLVDAQVTEIPRIFHDPLGTLDNKKPHVSDFAIPIIDFASFHVSRESVVEKIKAAAEKWGFFQVINHGVPLSVLEEIKDGVRRFHEEDLEVKKSYFSRDFTKKLPTTAISICIICRPLTGETPLVFTWTQIFQNLKRSQKHAGGLLFELLSEALGLSSEMLKSKGCMKGVLMLSHYYPPCPQPDLTLGTSKHSDNSFITILLQDQIGGLQVLHQDSWVDVSPLPGALLISNDKFIIVQHRVLANKAGPRISVASFFSTSMHPNSTVYGPIKELLSEENPPKYREFTIPEYSAGYLKKGVNDESHLSYFKI